MDSKRKVSQVFNSNPQGSWLRWHPKTDGEIVYKQILINAKLQIGKRGQKTKLTGRSPLRRWRFPLNYSAIKEEEEVSVSHTSASKPCSVELYFYFSTVGHDPVTKVPGL